jgi:hypothetical protein
MPRKLFAIMAIFKHKKLYNEEIAAFIERFIKDGEEGWCK